MSTTVIYGATEAKWGLGVMNTGHGNSGDFSVSEVTGGCVAGSRSEEDG